MTKRFQKKLTTPPPATSDGVLFADWRMQGGELVRRIRQPSEDRILDRNAELRKNPGALRELSFAGLELTIPELHYLRLIQERPDLHSSDAETKTRAWRAFIASSDADPYRVRDRYKSRARGGHYLEAKP